MNLLTAIGYVAAALLLPACATHSFEPAEPRDTFENPRPDEAGPQAEERQNPNTDATDASAAQSSTDDAWRNSVAFLIGGRELDKEDWEPLEHQFMFGLEGSFRPADSALGFEVGVSLSLDEESNVMGTGVDVNATIGEIYFGPRVSLDLTNEVVHPYLGAGVTFLFVDVEGELGGLSVSDDDTSVAGYLHSGVIFDVSDKVFLGFDLRGVFGSDLSLFGASADADYQQLALLVGTSF